MGANLVTLEAYKEYRAMNNPDNDGKRSLLISFVSELIKSYCGRTFIDHVITDKVEYFDARTPMVVLSEWPLLSVTHVKTSTDGGVTQTTLTENSVDLDGYFVDLENEKVFTQIEDAQFLYTVNHPYKSLEVSYLAGYTDENDEPDIPMDLKLAVFDLVAYYEDNEKTPSKTMASTTLDNPMPKLSNDFPAHIKRVLDLYRILDI